MRKIPVFLLAAACAATAFAAPGPVRGIIVTDNGEEKGLVKWSGAKHAYILTKKQGNMNVDLEFAAAQVTDLQIEKPKGFDQLVSAVETGRGSSAIKGLTDIQKDYAHLQWDRAASRYLAEAYLSANNGEKALQACKTVVDAEPEAAYKGELAPAYWKALLATGKKSTLEKALGKASASGDRYASGSALIMRGDMLTAGDDTAAGARQALVDGYLRVVLMYQDREVAAQLRPEALAKAAKCFEKMGQSGRADAMRSELKQKYASSPWAR